MLRLHNIVVPVDSSRASMRALDEALRLAGKTGAEVKILRVDVLHGDWMQPQEDAATEAEKLRERMRHLVERGGKVPGTFDPGGVRISHTLEREIAPVPAILRFADEQDADLIAMGTHGRRGLSRMLLGSVAEEVVRQASCPVLTVHSDAQANGQAPPIEAILVPIDFSTHSRLALAHAQQWAELYGARLDLLHVVEDYLHPAFYNMGAFSIHDLQPDIEERAKVHLEQFYSEAGADGSDVRFWVTSGHAAAEIVDFAADQTDLIIMATHGLTGLDRFLLGSVAEKVVRHAECPVLTVKPFGKLLIEAPEIGTAASQ